MKLNEAMQLNETPVTFKNVAITAGAGGTVALIGKGLSWLAATNLKASLIAAGLLTPAAVATGFVLYGTIAAGTIISVLAGMSLNKKALEAWGDSRAVEIIKLLDKNTKDRDKVIRKATKSKTKRSEDPKFNALTIEMINLSKELSHEIKKPLYSDKVNDQQMEYMKRISDIGKQGRLTQINIKNPSM